MATLKEIRLRLKSVVNIQKITKSMKMVSAAKYARAEKELRPARAYGACANDFFEKAEVHADPSKPNKLIVALTSDRGLCGGVHSSICKTIKLRLADDPSEANTKLILIGDKARQQLQKIHGHRVILSMGNIGKRPFTFLDAAFIADQILSTDYKFDCGDLYYNRFRSVISYRTSTMPMYTEENVNSAKQLLVYDSLDDETIQCYNEFAFVSRVYYALKEAQCSEQSARMSAMDSATKNADEMIYKLTMTFNRTRQAVITRELIEIISGAAAL